MTTDKAALLERAADALRESAERADADGQVGTADRDLDASLACAAWADELRAEPPWLDAPNEEGAWEMGRPGDAVEDVTTIRFERGTMYVWRKSVRGPVEISHHSLKGMRYRRRTPVVVPPREANP